MSDVKYVTVTSTEEIRLTPSHINSKFKTIQEWLNSVCEGNKPDTIISEFYINIMLQQPSNEYIVSLYGVNTSWDEKFQSTTRIDFKPINLYFKFPEKKYKNFTYKQMQGELAAQVKDFTTTEQFMNSFLSKANIRMSFSAEPIWVKK